MQVERVGMTSTACARTRGTTESVRAEHGQTQPRITEDSRRNRSGWTRPGPFARVETYLMKAGQSSKPCWPGQSTWVKPKGLEPNTHGSDDSILRMGRTWLSQTGAGNQLLVQPQHSRALCQPCHWSTPAATTSRTDKPTMPACHVRWHVSINTCLPCHRAP